MTRRHRLAHGRRDEISLEHRKLCCQAKTKQTGNREHPCCQQNFTRRLHDQRGPRLPPELFPVASFDSPRLIDQAMRLPHLFFQVANELQLQRDELLETLRFSGSAVLDSPADQLALQTIKTYLDLKRKMRL